MTRTRLGPALPALALLLAPTPAIPQFVSPIGAAQQSGASPAPARSTASVPATPTAQGAPSFEPAVIEASQPEIPATASADTESGTEAPPRAGPPSEFELHVSRLAGKPLRRFGAELLIPEARDFTAPPTVAVPDDYRLNPGDQLLIGLTGSVQASGLRLTIDRDGRIFVPRVGAIMVAGTRYGDVHDLIAREVGRQYRNFDLQVAVSRLRGLTVYVTGFAERPGSYTVGSLSTLVNAVLAAGGPAAGGSFRSIQLRRGGELVSDFDLYDLLLKGDKRGDAVLQNGDVIYIAPAGDQVAVVGAVNHEAIFEVGPGETIEDAILYAGGVNTIADNSRLLVLNTLEQSDEGWRELRPAEARGRPARRGDVIRVLSNLGIPRPLQQQPVLVTISGEVARPGRYYFQPGASLAHAIAEAGGLTPDAFPYASVITRESVREQQRESFDRAIKDMELLLTAQPLVSVDRAKMVQPANVALIRSVVEQMRDREPSGRLVFDLPVNATRLPEDLILENNDTIHVPARPVTVGVFGAVASPASFAYRDGRTIGDFIRAAGGVQKLGDDDEIFVVRANGTVLAKGGRVLRKPALPGDLIYVPVEANRGEFWARLRDISGTLFGGVAGAAAIKTLAE